MKTVREAFQEASSFLEPYRGQEAAFEAEWLLRALLDWERTQLFTSWQYPLTPEQTTVLQQWLLQRSTGEPLQYITGQQSFFGRYYHVTADVLIPRPETEELVMRVIQLLPEIKCPVPLRLVDVGTGSGVIAITCALEVPELEVIAIDRSPAALTVAKRNAQRHGVLERIDFVEGDLLSPVIEKSLPIQILVSNPPYIDTDSYDKLESQVRHFEPRLALDGGLDGLHLYRQLQHQLASMVEPPELVALEIGHDQGVRVPALFRTLAANRQVELEQDISGYDRIVWFWMKD